MLKQTVPCRNPAPENFRGRSSGERVLFMDFKSKPYCNWKEIPDFLQSLSSTLSWQHLTSCWLIKERYYKKIAVTTEQAKRWIWSWGNKLIPAQWDVLFFILDSFYCYVFTISNVFFCSVWLLLICLFDFISFFYSLEVLFEAYFISPVSVLNMLMLSSTTWIQGI